MLASRRYSNGVDLAKHAGDGNCAIESHLAVCLLDDLPPRSPVRLLREKWPMNALLIYPEFPDTD